MNSETILEYEKAVLWKIVLEGVGEQQENDKRIRRMLRRRGFGEYDQARIDALREFKEAISWELMKRQESAFYVGAEGGPGVTDMFNEDTLVSHFQKQHPGVSAAGIRAFVPFAIYNYYLR